MKRTYFLWNLSQGSFPGYTGGQVTKRQTSATPLKVPRDKLDQKYRNLPLAPFNVPRGRLHGDIQALPFRETLGGQQVQCLLMRAHGHLVSGTIVDLQCSQKQGIFLLKVCWVKKKKVLLVLHTHRAQLACSPLRWGFFLFLPLEVGIPFIDQHHSPCCQLDAGYHIGFSTWKGLSTSCSTSCLAVCVCK